MNRETFKAWANEKTIILDGATGSNLFKAGMPRGVCTEQWILENKEVEADLIRKYVEAGSNIVLAPTFGANRGALSRFGLENAVEDMNRELIELALKAADGKAYVAADLAPTGLLLESQGGDHKIEEVFEVYQEQARIAVSAGVDLIIAETQMSVDEATIAIDAALSVGDLPVLCSMSVTADGCAYYGGNIMEAVEVLQAMGASAVGLNCCAGPDQLESLIRNIAGIATVPVIAKPNAGMPVIDADGNAVYDMGPDAFAMHMKKLVEAGAGLVGGCCGTAPDYIKKVRMMLDGITFIC